MEYRALLRNLQDPYALAVRITADTGLRVSDVLAIRCGDIARTMKVRERKTGKCRKVTLSPDTLRRAKAYAAHGGEMLIDRNRSSVYRQITATARQLGYTNVSMHSLRKYYARRYCRAHGLRATQQELQHDYLSTTILYVIDPDQVSGMIQEGE